MSRHRQQKSRKILIAGVTAACVAGATGVAFTVEHGSSSAPAQQIALAASWTRPKADFTASPSASATVRKTRKHHRGPGHHHRPTAKPTTTAPSPTTPPPTTPPTTAPPSTRPTPSTTTPTARPTTTTPTPTRTTPTATPTTTSPTTPSSYQTEVIRLVNVERAKVGCNALTANTALTNAAQAHAQDMLAHNYFSHDSQDGTSPFTRMTNAGYKWSSAAENIAAGQSTPASVMTSWMNSAGHKANILNCGLKDIGVGYAAGPGATYGQYWVQDFGSPL